MLDDIPLSRWLRRLADELEDGGIELPGDAAFQQVVLEELDHCRRAPMFEGRRPSYGAMILPAGAAQTARDALDEQFSFDVVPLEGGHEAARSYADGRASYLVRSADGLTALACFEHSLVFEADLVTLQGVTRAAIVQRTPVLDVVRVAVDDAMVLWNGSTWESRPTAISLVDDLLAGSPELGHDLATDVLELAIHTLAPSRIGTTIVIHHDRLDPNALDTTTAAHTPALSIGNRHHFSALQAVIRQHDLAVVASADGAVRKVAVGLRWSDEAESAIDNDRGMRHRSAQRYSFDQHDATVVVVSEDGPVTVYRRGEVIVTTRSR